MYRTRLLAAGAAALAVVLGGGAALAAAGSSNPASDFLGDVASRLGISQGKLEDAIADATSARIDAAVAAGDITKEEGDALKERVRSGEVPAILPGFHGHRLGLGPLGIPRPGHVGGTDLLGPASDYLGLDEADVREALRDGKSLADLATEKGKSVDGLKQALRDAIRKDADKAVGDGALTKEQADRMVERLSGAVDEIVDKPCTPGLEFDFPGPRLAPGPLGPPGKPILPGALPDLMGTAADFLGMDRADVRKAIGDGKSLADLAKDKGKSVDGLKEALRDAVRKDADKAVEDGVLTKEQADGLVEKLGSAVDELVEGGGFGFGFRRGGGKFEFHFRILPEGRMPPPQERQNPSFEPAIPSHPI